jgi:O-antigen ligase
VPLLVLVPSLLLTSSRGAWLAFLAGAAVLAVARGGVRRGPIAAVGIAGAGVLAAILVVTEDLQRFITENRWRYWEVAWADFRDHPWLGSGAGTFGDYWLVHRSTEAFSRTAHSLYLQSLAELGPVGLVLVVVALACPLLALTRRRDPLVATAAAGYAAYAVHAGIDWDWQMPAVTLAGFFCGAALLVATRPRVSPLGRRARFGLACVALGVAAVAVFRLENGGGGPFGPFGG